MTVGSLFSGFGGLDLGLERAGLRVIWQCENNPYARRVLARLWPDVPCHEDVADVDALVPRPDLICGGDPCQGNSKANMGRMQPREDLGIEFLRVVESIRPRLVLRENPSETVGNAPWPWWRFRAGLERLGYVVLPFRLRACCVGADHRRERLFLLAEHADAGCERREGFDREGFEAWHPGGTAGDRIRGNIDRLPASRVLRAGDGVPDRMERTRGLGNAVHVAVGEFIGCNLISSLRHAEAIR